MLAIIGASGKLGGSTLDALLSLHNSPEKYSTGFPHPIPPPSFIIALTSSQPSSPTWTRLQAKGVQVRHASFDDGQSMETALQGVSKLFLVSTPKVELDFGFGTAGGGPGRETHHRTAIDAAIRAGVQHIYYASLAFGNPSKAGVMRAHVVTEKYLASIAGTGTSTGTGQPLVTIIREGLYNESWPLYLSYFKCPSTSSSSPSSLDSRTSLLLPPGDGPICWTSIADLGLANALVLSSPSPDYAGRTVYLSTPPGTALSMSDVAKLVSDVSGESFEIKRVPTQEYVERSIDELGIDEGHAHWWASTYDALADGECRVDDGTLVEVLGLVGVGVGEGKGKGEGKMRAFVSMRDSVTAMVKGR